MTCKFNATCICIYIVYRYSRGRWSSEGVKTVSVTSVGDIVTVTCASSHLTSFAILVDVGGTQVMGSLLMHECS